MLGDQEMVALVPADSWLASKASVGYAELAKEPFVRGTGGCADVLTPIARQAGVEFDVAFEARKMSTHPRPPARFSTRLPNSISSKSCPPPG